MRRWWIGMGIVVAAALGAGSARACMMCSTSLTCVWSPAGARWCIGGNAVCVLGGTCSLGAAPSLPADEVPMLQMSLLESPAGALPAASRVVASAGPVSTGRNALRIAGADRDAGGDERILFSGRGMAGGGTGVFRTRMGDGFTLTFEHDVRGTQATVCALAGNGPGRELARETLGEDDALVVRVPFEGRPRVLVLQVSASSGFQSRQRGDEADQAIREASLGRTQPTRPPFELRVIDR